MLRSEGGGLAELDSRGVTLQAFIGCGFEARSGSGASAPWISSSVIASSVPESVSPMLFVWGCLQLTNES